MIMQQQQQQIAQQQQQQIDREDIDSNEENGGRRKRRQKKTHGQTQKKPRLNIDTSDTSVVPLKKLNARIVGPRNIQVGPATINRAVGVAKMGTPSEDVPPKNKDWNRSTTKNEKNWR